ncbi:MAG: flagellar hook capping FlgD N-terminal domain-containing protein, partial [Planctomycetota bacterium]|nr:flagellar hook capping FlgD N-terminal domain-containing protein [Planctomycetota bacterium]
GFSALSSDEFLRIMFTELTNQDPLAPNETKQILDQIGTIRSIESNESLTRNLGSILEQSQVASSSGFIGKLIAGRTDAGHEVEGTVISVSLTREGPILNLFEGHRVPMDRVTEVTDPNAFSVRSAGAAQPA